MYNKSVFLQLAWTLRRWPLLAVSCMTSSSLLPIWVSPLPPGTLETSEPCSLSLPAALRKVWDCREHMRVLRNPHFCRVPWEAGNVSKTSTQDFFCRQCAQSSLSLHLLSELNTTLGLHVGWKDRQSPWSSSPGQGGVGAALLRLIPGAPSWLPPCMASFAESLTALGYRASYFWPCLNPLGWGVATRPDVWVLCPAHGCSPQTEVVASCSRPCASTHLGKKWAGSSLLQHGCLVAWSSGPRAASRGWWWTYKRGRTWPMPVVRGCVWGSPGNPCWTDGWVVGQSLNSRTERQRALSAAASGPGSLAAVGRGPSTPGSGPGAPKQERYQSPRGAPAAKTQLVLPAPMWTVALKWSYVDWKNSY